MSTPSHDEANPARDAGATPTPLSPAASTPSSPETPDFPQMAGADPVGPSAMLQAPWRLEYLQALSESEQRAEADKRPKPATGSFLEAYWLSPASDPSNHVIVRTAHGMVLLNAYPYSNGHLLIALGEARPRLLDYSPEQRRQLWMLTDLATDLVERTLQCQGVNIGVNQGRAAGAGVPGHLHVHAVPRWGGDTNFMGVVARVRVIPSSLTSMHERFEATWTTVRSTWAPLIAE